MKKIRLELKNKIFPLIYCNKLNKLFEITQKVSSALHEWDRIIWPKTTIDFLSQKIGSEIIAPTTPSTSTAILCKNQQKIWGLISVNDNFIQKLLPLQWWILHISHLNALFTRNNTLPTTTDENQEKKCIYILKIFLPLVSICWDIIIIWRKLRLGLSSK